MKYFLPIATIGMISFLIWGFAAKSPFPPLDKSPMDAAVYPKRGNDKMAKVYYSRPAKNNRQVFGKLVKYDKVWRTGANECTEITLYQDASINNEKVSAGTYSLFTIPGEKNWTFILNSHINQWGAYRYKDDKDVLRTTVAVENTDETVEHFSMSWEHDKKANTTYLLMAWDKTLVKVPFTFTN